MEEAYGDVLASQLGETGFDSFETDGHGLWAYVQTSLFDKASVEETLQAFPFEGVKICWHAEDMPREDWNAAWEQQFEPIAVGDLVYIHDVRHEASPSARYDILIQPRMAFGSGSHATTRMMLRLLLEDGQVSDKAVLDVGCGTGILGIGALKGGCERLTAIDIDNDSVENTIYNIALNGFAQQRVMEGDISVLAADERYDIILANIHLNIHLALMGDYARHLNPGGRLLLSGFYADEAVPVLEAAAANGLALEQQTADDSWCAMSFRKTKV